MRVGIIVDGNEVIGLGHVIRCKVIAKHLITKKVNVTFIIPTYIDKNLINTFDSIFVSRDKWADINNNHEYIKSLLKNCDSVLLDLVEQKYLEFSFLQKLPLFIVSLSLFKFKRKNYFGDIAFFPTITKEHYNNDKTQIWTGPQYFIIDDDITNAKKEVNSFNSVPKILISMGGADPANITEKIVQSTCYFEFEYQVILIAGKVNTNKDYIKSLVEERSNFKYYEFVDEINDIYSQIDFAIINGGNTRYELTVLQIPYACISIHTKQNSINDKVTKLYGGLNLGVYNEISATKIAKEIQRIIKSPIELSKIRQRMGKFKGGNGHLLIAEALIKKNK